MGKEALVKDGAVEEDGDREGEGDEDGWQNSLFVQWSPLSSSVPVRERKVATARAKASEIGDEEESRVGAVATEAGGDGGEWFGKHSCGWFGNGLGAEDGVEGERLGVEDGVEGEHLGAGA